MNARRHHQLPLGPYLDGEVSGLERLRVANHLEQCGPCAKDAAEWREIGDLLRTTATAEPLPEGLEGLAGGVVSRIRAERAQSWHSMFMRAFDDWHWFAAIGGSFGAACVSTLLVALLLQFGPTPHRDDSLAGLLSNLQSPAGTLFLVGSQDTSGTATPILMRYLDGSGDNDGAVMQVSLNVPDSLVTEQDLVTKLSDTLSARGPLDSMSLHPKDRSYAETLLRDINKLHFPDDSARPSPTVRITQFLLMTSVGVSAKGI